MYDQDNPTAVEVGTDPRLPTIVKPTRYDLRLEPNLPAANFSGEETIAIEVERATDQIVLHALELEILEAEAARGATRLQGKVEFVPALEQARLRFDHALEPGGWTLRLRFKGILNDKLHGFYRSQYRDPAGAEHLIASTQFEATDARRAFPCWDEPAFKARFKVTLVVAPGLTAISNAGVESERKLPDGRQEVVFRDSIPMSTYLVAFIVGEFVATAPVDAGTPLRVVHVPGKQALTGWALQIGAFSLKFFANYYGLPYPGDKLDLIAIPDFASGAMENLGAITFRETALLIDDRQASRAELERVADVVSHENAHMWFGDLVTMQWWNGIWLNEAFATFMEMLAVDAWKPHWRRWESFALSRGSAMAIDGLSSTRSIEYPVRTAEDARAMFDVLTYEKGAAVLRMLEQYLGAEEFRKGIALYLRRHEYGNTETGDLWDALQESSREPVRSLMDSWIFQPGFPIVEAAKTADGKGLRLSQRRFFYLPQADAEPQRWHIPVMVRVRTADGAVNHKLLMDAAEAKLDAGEPFTWALVNEGGHGFYRVSYAPELLAALTHSLGELKPTERFGLMSDSWVATVAGLKPVDEFLAFARRFSTETDLNVWRALAGAFNYLDLIVDDRERAEFASAVRSVAGPAFERMGWEPKPGEDELTRQLRGTLANISGTLGEDPGIQRQAVALYERARKDPASVDRDVMPALVAIVGHSGDAARYAEFKQNFKSAQTPQGEQRYLFALAAFTRPELLRETMAMTLNGEVRTQNAPYLMHALLVNRACRYEAWDFMRRNWDQMTAKFPDAALPRMCEGVTVLLDRESEVREFFATHRVRLGGKLIDQHLERLAVAVAFREREGARLSAALREKPSPNV
ncbi:MAG TPA: M1 family metallopeptidase [Candidatus Binataceae bacterium]|nr:M1 family metallopeptidase [Candidatus Binataceae bacterium]